MLRGLAVLLFVATMVFMSLPQLVSAGQDGPGQGSVRIGNIHSHDGLPPLRPFGQDGPGQ
jgi:hypothetical protein